MLLRVAWLLLAALAAAEQAVAAQARTGAEIFEFACAGCHGSDGRGTPAVAFDLPVIPPDLADCNFSTREPASDWVGLAHTGGPGRAFSRLMPSFTESLTREEIELAVSHARSFCTDDAWPRGDLNFPRPLVTTKAFPEDEIVTSFAADGGAVTNKYVYEKRLGSRSQFELIVPLAFSERPGGHWTGGVGDLAFAFKRVLAANLGSGTIVSGAAELVVPTGSAADGLGGDTTVLEPFLAVGQRLPSRMFLHVQAGSAIAFDRNADDEAFWRLVVGRNHRERQFGRLWAPMVELLGSRALGSGRTTHWDVVPQLHVTLSTRQHVRVNVGARIPVNDRAGRSTQYLGYLMWEWFNGAFLEGW